MELGATHNKKKEWARPAKRAFRGVLTFAFGGRAFHSVHDAEGNFWDATLLDLGLGARKTGPCVILLRSTTAFSGRFPSCGARS